MYCYSFLMCFTTEFAFFGLSILLVRSINSSILAIVNMTIDMLLLTIPSWNV